MSIEGNFNLDVQRNKRNFGNPLQFFYNEIEKAKMRKGGMTDAEIIAKENAITESQIRANEEKKVA